MRNNCGFLFSLTILLTLLIACKDSHRTVQTIPTPLASPTAKNLPAPLPAPTSRPKSTVLPVPLPADATPTNITSISPFSIENQEGYIAFLSNRNSYGSLVDLFIMKPDGNNVTRLAKNVAAFAWAPDGKRIAFATPVFSRLPGIFIADIETGNIRKLTNDGTAPSWSPDGTRIAFVSQDRRLAVINVFIGPRRYLTPAEYAYRLPLGHPAQWSPDGTQLLFAVGTNTYLVDVNGGDPVHVVKSEYKEQSPPGAPIAASVSPVWSPDGKHFAFVSLRDDPYSGYQLYIADADGSNPTRLTSLETVGTASSPSWSPDGTRIAFINFYGIYVINVDGSQLVQLTDIEPDSKPSWSPDGRWIVFEKDYDIYVFSIAEIHLSNLTDSELKESKPVWSP